MLPVEESDYVIRSTEDIRLLKRSLLRLVQVNTFTLLFRTRKFVKHFADTYWVSRIKKWAAEFFHQLDR